jgi:integrase
MYPLIEHKPQRPPPWNEGKLIGQKPPLKPQEIWTIRIHLELQGKTRDLALFNLAIDSKLRGCDLVAIKVSDIAHGTAVQPRARIIQQKTMRPVQFEITDQARLSVERWIAEARLTAGDQLFPSRIKTKLHISTREYARRTKNLRAVQLLLGHTKLESTIRYLGIEVDDALELAEQTEV